MVHTLHSMPKFIHNASVRIATATKKSGKIRHGNTAKNVKQATDNGFENWRNEQKKKTHYISVPLNWHLYFCYCCLYLIFLQQILCLEHCKLIRTFAKRNKWSTKRSINFIDMKKKELELNLWYTRCLRAKIVLILLCFAVIISFY